MAAADVIATLAKAGLVFTQGLPPVDEEGVKLVWFGGCNAVACIWRDGKLREWGDGSVRELGDVECWMRMPHPSIWPVVEGPVELVPEADLYDRRGDVLTLALTKTSC